MKSFPVLVVRVRGTPLPLSDDLVEVVTCPRGLIQPDPASTPDGRVILNETKPDVTCPDFVNASVKRIEPIRCMGLGAGGGTFARASPESNVFASSGSSPGRRCNIFLMALLAFRNEFGLPKRHSIAKIGRPVPAS